MTTQILRTIDRWHFEAPLALALGASAGFFAWTVPAELFTQIPVAGEHGLAGRAAVAAVLAVLCAGVAYLAMRRRPAKPAEPAEIAEPIDEIAEEEPASGMPTERLRRFRRADAHPDAPPREPIIASRDLGEPFMDVGGFAPPAAVADAPAEDAWWPETSIPDGDFVEVGDEPAAHPVEALAEETPVADAPVAETPIIAAEPAIAPPAEVEVAAKPAPAPQPVPPETAAPAEPMMPRGSTISAMMERLSAGLERRAGSDDVAEAPPARDMRPALRDALNELNRLAVRRD
jgi:hypothetical protein